MEKLDLFRAVVENLEEQGYDAKLIENYSGRGGFQGPAISTEVPPVVLGWSFAVTVAANADEDALAWDLDFRFEDLPKREDSHGKANMLYY